jgi:hypothetical protein
LWRAARLGFTKCRQGLIAGGSDLSPTKALRGLWPTSGVPHRAIWGFKNQKLNVSNEIRENKKQKHLKVLISKLALYEKTWFSLCFIPKFSEIADFTGFCVAHVTIDAT